MSQTDGCMLCSNSCSQEAGRINEDVLNASNHSLNWQPLIVCNSVCLMVSDNSKWGEETAFEQIPIPFLPIVVHSVDCVV